LGRLQDGDLIEIVIDRNTLEGRVDLVGWDEREFGAQEGARELARRSPREDLQADPALPDDTRLWAALQDVSGGAWGGAVFDVDRIIEVLDAGRKALADKETLS
jgi:xylonate dehydratase